ncbi:MAG: hypothetical protein PVJ57_12220 [Phycisphaerae bacterium]|jgi:hypothetical protein
MARTKKAPQSSTPARAQSFEAQLAAAFQQFRGALTELLTAVHADPDRPQDVARKFKLDKNLTWKVSRIVNTPDSFSAVQHMPGTNGLNILLHAFEANGAPAATVARARTSFGTVHQMVTKHLGDRGTLEIALDGLSPGPDNERLELSRKLAFRGNSGIWGVQARVRAAVGLLAPTADSDDLVDVALVSGWVDFRRLRPDARWRLFTARAYHDDGTSADRTEVPIEDDSNRRGKLMLIPSFCTETMPPILETRERDAVVYELGEGPVGNSGAFTCFCGAINRGFASRYRDEHNTRGEFTTHITAPAETLLFDVLVHRDLPFAMRPAFSLYGMLLANPTEYRDSDKLPIAEKIVEIGAYPPVVATALVPRYTELVNAIYHRGNWDPRDFVGLRFMLKYPPFPSTAVLAFPLLERA